MQNFSLIYNKIYKVKQLKIMNIEIMNKNQT